MQSNEKYKRLKIRREEKWTRCRRKRIEEEGESVVSSRRLNMGKNSTEARRSNVRPFGNDKYLVAKNHPIYQSPLLLSM